MQDAFRSGPENREKIVYIPAVQPKGDKPDYLMTVDVDPDSDSFSQVRSAAADQSVLLTVA